MKFRCERDVLVEALGAAGRAVANRGGALPVLSGVRAELQGDHLSLTGSDLDLTISVEAQVTGEDDGVAVLPARIASDVVRSLEPGKVSVGSRTTRRTSPPAASSRPSGCCRPTSSRGWARRPRTRSPCRRRTSPTRSARSCPAASADDARPILTGVLMTAEADGLRLVATDSYRLAVRDLPGQSVLREGQSVLVPSRALRELERLLAGTDEVTLRLGERDATFEIGSVKLTTRLIEGEFPNYRGLIPSSYPNVLTVGREALMDAVRRVKLMAREATPVRVSMSSDGPRAGGDHPGRRPGPRAARRQVRGHRADRGLQPGVPPRRHRASPRATRSRSRRSTTRSRRSSARSTARSSSTCSCPSGSDPPDPPRCASTGSG